jgi:hypothetical protein
MVMATIRFLKCVGISWQIVPPASSATTGETTAKPENVIMNPKGNRMFEFTKNKILLTITLLAFLLSACGSQNQTQDQIAAAVEQTVQAQNSLTKVAELPTWTPAPMMDTPPTTAPDVTATNTAAPISGAPGCTVSARLAGESPPDDALLKPGELFWKTWSLENTGTCTWDQTYQLVFSSGELMGGLISYPLPEVVRPGETKQISIYLKAPETEGTATGYWRIQTPWNAYFGVGPAGTAGSPFYVQVVVSNAAKPNYGITSVTYKLDRDPPTGCPRNVWYTVNAIITANGPFEFQYHWAQSDGNNSGVQTMKFTEAGTKTISRVWKVGAGDSPNPRWMRIIVTDPVAREYDRFIFENNCP